MSQNENLNSGNLKFYIFLSKIGIVFSIIGLLYQGIYILQDDITDNTIPMFIFFLVILGIGVYSIAINHRQYNKLKIQEDIEKEQQEKQINEQIISFKQWINNIDMPDKSFYILKQDLFTHVRIPYYLWMQNDVFYFLINIDIDNLEPFQLSLSDILDFYEHIPSTFEMEKLFNVKKNIITFYKNDHKSLMNDNSLSYQQKQEKIQNWFINGNVIRPNMRKYLLSLPDEDKFISILLSSIQYYRVIGDIRYQTDITGGGGGGTSIGGAIVGGMIAGETGAIIGSRKKVEAIRSETTQIDDRYIELVFLDNSGFKQIMKFDYQAFDVFEELIPDKEYTIVQEKKRRQILGDDIEQNRDVEKESDITDQIEKLFQLVEKGILTEDEFIAKKKELLSRI